MDKEFFLINFSNVSVTVNEELEDQVGIDDGNFLYPTITPCTINMEEVVMYFPEELKLSLEAITTDFAEFLENNNIDLEYDDEQELHIIEVTNVQLKSGKNFLLLVDYENFKQLKRKSGLAKAFLPFQQSLN